MDARTDEASGPPVARLAWLLDRFRQHPKTGVLSLAVVWGGAIVLHHFYRIGYLPVLAMSDLLGVAMASAAIGLILLVSVAVAMIAPGLMLVYWRRSGVGPRNAVLLRADQAFRSRWKHRDYAWLSAAAAAVGLAAYIAMLYYDRGYLLFVCMIPPMVVAIMLETPLRHRFVIAPSRSRWVTLFFLSYCYTVAWAFTLMVVLLWREDDGDTFLAKAAGLAIGAVVLHLVMLRTADMPRSTRVLIPAMLVLYVLVFTSSLSTGASRIVNFFGLGQIPRVDIALTKSGCDTVNAVWSKRPCVAVGGRDPSAYLLADVDLVTRIGPHYLVGERGTVADLENRRLLRVAVRSEDVLGWARVRDDNPPP
ncbi:hypothetical protein K4L06_07300 [Lysobacter sp. BMK333-48F3]|uniref:hypothetical protein n=1 Tax=Lysobacter sp. BMK333-48F3 TaxID=2867962 RepID=UPI001C8CD047|nr:hypothetical protein [Lysobacter sp. BMK333-48F3]MBX9401116.1 hypothetical protein [Lysobacter sp. BMK333-48F3]